MMADRVIAAAGLGSILVVACMAGAVAGADEPEGGVMAGMCAATGLGEGEECKNGNIKEAKEFIKEAFDAAVAELEMVIKNTSFYKKLEKDHVTRGALSVCEEVLADSIDDLHTSFEKISQFEIGQMDRALDVVKIWLSSAITYKDTCFDAFAKTRGSSKRVVRQMLIPCGELLRKALAMVIDFQENFQTIKKNLGELMDSVEAPRHLLEDGEFAGLDDGSDDEIPDFVSGHARQLFENPKIALKPNVVVAKDGSGQFKTITEAIQSVPLKNDKPYVILVKAGVYEEYVNIPKMVDEVILVGEGPLKTRITGNKCFTGGVQTWDSATLSVNGRSFIAKDIGIENTAGPIGEQAVAVRATGDVGIYYNVHFDGYQDTLYPTNNRQFFRDCRVSGTIDFIFGNAIAVFQKCDLVVRKPDPGQQCMVTAQGRTEKNLTGVTIIQGCTIKADDDYLNAQPPPRASFLGRPWKELSRTIIMQSTIEGFISPDGWAPWHGDFGLDTLYYVEYNNTGPGADLSKRVKWKGIQKVDTDKLARPWTPLVHFVEDGWIRDSGVPFDPEFMQV